MSATHTMIGFDPARSGDFYVTAVFQSTPGAHPNPFRLLYLSTARAKGDTRSVSQPSSIARRGLPCGQAAVNPPTGVRKAPGPISSRASDAAAHAAKAAGGRKISSVPSHV